MSTHDSSLGTTLDRLVPELDVSGDWEAVLRGAGRRTRRRRRVVALGVAVAALAIGVSPVGGAIADGVGDFSAWLRGTPGTPASSTDQEAFEQANGRSWAGFPPGTELRKLIFWALTQGQKGPYTAKLWFSPIPKVVLVAAEKTHKQVQPAT